MPSLQGENVVATQGSPVKRSKLSLKFFQKKEAKRALDFSETQSDEPTTTTAAAEPEEPADSCEQLVYGPAPCPASPGVPLSCQKRDNLLPFVGFNNLGNTCYLNSILQVLYFCPGFREGLKKLYDLSKRKDKPKEEAEKSEEQPDCVSETPPTHIELIGSFNSLITSVEELQSNFLLHPESFSDGELATPPRKVLHTLRRLNPMYEGFFQHDAQEVLQCILGYIQEACHTIKKEQDLEKVEDGGAEDKMEDDGRSGTEPKLPSDDNCQISGKRKSDTEVGNAKKKTKSVKCKKSDASEENACKRVYFTRSKRKSSTDITPDGAQNKDGKKEGKKKPNQEESHEEEEGRDEVESKSANGKKKKRGKLSWLRPSGKQPSIFSKFCSVGKISSTTTRKKVEEEDKATEERSDTTGPELPAEEQNSAEKHQGLGLLEDLFQGQLVLRTRCLECESFTERREDFQDISVPVLDDQPSSPSDVPQVSPDPKPELKTLRWAISQFASVERIVGEDKYFCETCRHYTEAERSLLFDKTPEVITIHLKRFSANSVELDSYAGLSKVNTPLHTPLTLSLEEWCTTRSSTEAQRYQLFAVVMHSGVTISCGHYTAYVRVSDLKDVKLWTRDKKDTEEEDGEEETQKDGAAGYDDGEVSFSLNPRGQRCPSLADRKPGSKKLSEGGVGLLGGQRSLSSCDLGNGGGGGKQAGGSKRRKTIGGSSQNAQAALKKKPEDTPASSGGGTEDTEQRALTGLLDYEGKWLLFDDSEVCLFEEEDFLRACSPETCSSSTPYLLFYKRIPEPGR